MKNILIAVFGLMVVSACNTKTESLTDLPLESELDSFSYSIGLDVGLSTKENNKHIQSINLDAFALGVKEAFELDSNRRIDEKALQDIIVGYLERVSKEAETKYLEEKAAEEGVSITESGIIYKELLAGEGRKPMITDTVVIHYVGKIMGGEEFNNTFKYGSPMKYPMSGGMQGWTEALQLMTVGSKYQFTIPSNLMFGSTRNRQIPPYSPLDFEMELIEIK